MKCLKFLALCSVLLLTACGAHRQPYDYTALQANQPKSIVIVTPKNDSVDVNASYAVMSWAAQPLAEKGYYVFPVAVVDEVFKQNGVTDGHVVSQISTERLRKIFGADAALYLQITDYGTKYLVFDSRTTVSVNATLIDLKTGKVLWTKSVTADDSQDDSSGLLVALVKQIVNNVSDTGFKVTGNAMYSMFSTGYDGAILYGPRSPYFQKDPQLKK